MIRSLLIANRGEIACRIGRTARALGIRIIAVHSDADAQALHVRCSDDAIRIGPPPASESYLRGDRIIEAALASGADAIHPGYGFLSENADFAQAVIDAGLIWVGPDPASIRAMGLKDAAKALMQAAGVPVTPGYMGGDQSPENLFKQAETIGYPVLIKAVAGGGGKGMRKVDAPGDFLAALQSCKREASASFGNDVVLLEKRITAPRHIEVQVFGDSHGNIVHLFERDCSLQRRHQKVIEEAPAPGMDAATRDAICAAAVRAAQAVDYVGAGTVEFIADVGADNGWRLSAERIWFMEMNTRLQVEHPVTEAITGIDLVEWQLRVACGEPLPLRQEDIGINGHAIEARLYAEDPAKGFLPSTGRLELASFPADDIRIDTGVEAGDTIGPYYDPMMAKLIAHGADRNAAIAKLSRGIEALRIWPVMTNAPFLLACLHDPEWRAGAMTTGLIARRGDALTAPIVPNDADWNAAARRLCAPYLADRGSGVWNDVPGFRLNGAERSAITIQHSGERRRIDLATARQDSRLPESGPPELCSTAEPVADGVVVWRGGSGLLFTPPRFNAKLDSAADGAILSPMPGRVIALDVAEGDAVNKGQRLMVLEAMKMEHPLTAPFDGVVEQLAVTPGQQVRIEELLARVARGEAEG